MQTHYITPKRIQTFQEKIITWFDENGRKFPWRKSKLTHYQLVIAEVLLQRTKAETIQKFYPVFIKRYPNWKSLHRTKKNTLEKVLQPIGLFRQRAALLKKLAREMNIRNGHLPNKREEIEKLPFAGQYIVNAIMLLIKKKPAPLLDVNMARVLERYFGPRKLSDIRYDPYLQELAWKVVQHEETVKINWGILDFAALICRASKPNCNYCFLNTKCRHNIQTKIMKPTF